jgi:hypothetical protein
VVERWTICGATGYTGSLIAEESVRRGLRPVLASRDAFGLQRLAERLGLPHTVVALDITGEIDVFVAAQAASEQARQAGVLLCPGAVRQISGSGARASTRAGCRLRHRHLAGRAPVAAADQAPLRSCRCCRARLQ